MEKHENFEPEWIWADDQGTVYAQGYGCDLTVIFSFSANKEGNPPTSLANRVCNKFENIETDDPGATIATIPDLHTALWASIRHLWPHILSRTALRLDDVVAIESSDSSVENLGFETTLSGVYRMLLQVSHLTLLPLFASNSSAAEAALLSNWRREYNTLHRLPPHPNIMPPPTVPVTIQWPDQSAQPVFCGALFPFYTGRNVESRIQESNKAGARIAPRLKAHWCANMASAVFHTRRVAMTYHKDIKPGNFVVDEDDSLKLCDWEQHEDVSSNWRPQLHYTKYSGPPRRNVHEDVLEDAPWHTWDVFPIWTTEHPWALELAEVFSLGRTMWMLLRQPKADSDDIKHPDDITTDWDESDDILSTWKQMVDRCMSRDANERPDLEEFVVFWTKIDDQETVED
ncbi:hypothetical protein FAUST_1438 [Fusarium austroamericanum]|uniref:Protein kinase domain-containing protein n=1 Tax=Fusarium austroamericanum TaxID=282268 RepID=A0AAN6HJS6_FUSAU|nr:hypothetical protein FAUST_1438 [Fusarium austroamericanum]